MKLQEYFNQEKSHGLSDAEKMSVYYSVMEKNLQKTYKVKRSFLHVKSLVYGSFLFFILVGFYGMYLFQWPMIEDEWYLLSRLSDNANVAQADFVAKVVDFNGNFYIEQEWKTIQTSNIKDWDIVTLKQNAQVVFHIDDDTKAKITGPARFVIEKTSQSSYKLAMFYGEYIEMSSLQKESKNKYELAVDWLLVSQWDSKKAIDFQLVKQGKTHTLKNNWASLAVISDDKETNLAEQQVLSMQGDDIAVFDNFDKFAKAVKDKKLSQTFSLLNTIENTENTTWHDSIKELSESEILQIEDKDLPEIDLWFAKNQTIVTPDQLNLIENWLSDRFVQENVDNLILAYQDWDDIVFSQELEALETKISTIAKEFAFDYKKVSWTEQEKVLNLISLVDNLAKQISTEYSIPPKYIDKITKVSTLLAPIKWKEFVAKDLEDPIEDLEVLEELDI